MNSSHQHQHAQTLHNNQHNHSNNENGQIETIQNNDCNSSPSKKKRDRDRGPKRAMRPQMRFKEKSRSDTMNDEKDEGDIQRTESIPMNKILMLDDNHNHIKRIIDE